MSVKLALAGDCLITRSWEADPPLTQLMWSADAAFCNVETLFHDFEHPPMATAGGLHMQADPDVAATLRRLNIKLGSIANNHACDYGADTLLQSRRVLEAQGVRCSGGGASLSEARSPTVLELEGVSIALVSATSTFPDHALPSNGLGRIKGRPGINPLRFATVVAVTAEEFRSLESILAGVATRTRADPPSLLLPSLAIVGAEGHATLTIPHPMDLDEISKVIHQAAIDHDVVLVSMHSHELDGSGTAPARFLRLAARRFIDEGAAAVLCHGPHVPGGVELLRGVPIFYSLGNFFFEIEHVTQLPPDAYAQMGLPTATPITHYLKRRASLGAADFLLEERYWRSYIALLEVVDKRITSIDLHPIDLGPHCTDGERGRPRLAVGSLAASILDTIRDRSAAFGTPVRGSSIGRVTLQ